MSATISKTTLRSTELSCPSCVAKIEKELQRVEGVVTATVHFNSGRIVVEHDRSRASNEALVDAVGRAGYSAKASAF
jgi:copper chaperone